MLRHVAPAVAGLVLAAGVLRSQQFLTLPASNTVFSMAFSPDSKLLAVGMVEKQAIVLYELPTGKEQHMLLGHPNLVTALAFSSDGKTLVSASSDVVYKPGVPPDPPLETGVALKPRPAKDRTYFSVVKHWDVATWRETQTQRLEGGGLNLALSAHGNRLLTVTGYPNDVAKVWDLATGKARELRGHTGHVYQGAFSPDGKLAVVCSGSIMKLWDLSTGKACWSAAIYDGRVVLTTSNLSFSPDRKTVAIQHMAGSITFWDVATGKQRERGLAGGRPFCFSPDGKAVAALSGCIPEPHLHDPDPKVGTWYLEMEKVGGQDRPVLRRGIPGIGLYSVATGKLLAAHGKDGVKQEVSHLRFSPDGRFLAAAKGDGTIRIYAVSP